jgi:hypothetical protein
MSVAIDTDATAREKTEFDAEFDTDEHQMTDDEPICDLSCGTAFTI